MTLTPPELFPYPSFSPQMRVADVCTAVLAVLYERMLYHEPGTRTGEDIEELHDMRVSVRRQRVAVRVFTDYYLSESNWEIQMINNGLRILGRALGQGRDLDILIDKFKLYLLELSPEKMQEITKLNTIWKHYRDQAQVEMISFLDSHFYHDLVSRYKDFLNKPQQMRTEQVVSELPILIEQRLQALFDHEQAVETKVVHQLHRLRIAFKRLRYVIEFFESVLGTEYENLILQLKQIQDHLGDLNDAAFATHYISTLLMDWDQVIHGIPTVEPEHKILMTAYLDVRQQELEMLMDTFPERWTIFLQSGFIETLRQSAALEVF